MFVPKTGLNSKGQSIFSVNLLFEKKNIKILKF